MHNATYGALDAAPTGTTNRSWRASATWWWQALPSS